MRAVRFATVAFQAEQVRIGHFLRRGAVRLVLGMAAVMFVLSAFVAAESGLFLVMADYITRAQSLLALAGLNVAVAAMLAAAAARSRPGPAERESGELARAAAGEIVPALGVLPTAVVLLQTVMEWMKRRER